MVSGSRYLSQEMSPLPRKPVSQVHIIVLKGSVFCTWHTAFSAHGLMATQGFWHSLFIQASRVGHSLSPLQPGSSTGTRMENTGYKLCL